VRTRNYFNTLSPISWVLIRRWIDRRHKRRLISEIVNYLSETRSAIKNLQDFTHKPFDAYFTVKEFIQKYGDELEINDRVVLEDPVFAIIFSDRSHEQVRG
jgi:hypothetical protein